MADSNHSDYILNFLNDLQLDSESESEPVDLIYDRKDAPPLDLFHPSQTISDSIPPNTNTLNVPPQLLTYDDVCRAVDVAEDTLLNEYPGDDDQDVMAELEDAFQPRKSTSLIREALRYNQRSQKILMAKLKQVEEEMAKLHAFSNQLKVLKDGPYYKYSTFLNLTRVGDRPMTDVQKWNNQRCLPRMYCAPFFSNEFTGSTPAVLEHSTQHNALVQYLQSGRTDYSWSSVELDQLRDFVTVEFKKHLYIKLGNECTQLRRQHGSSNHPQVIDLSTKMKSLGGLSLPDLIDAYGDPMDVFSEDMWRTVSCQLSERHLLDVKLAWKLHARPGINVEPFSKDEKKKVRELVQRFGMGRWEEIAREIGNGRTNASVFLTWKEEDVASTPIRAWTKEEDEKLLTILKMDPDMPISEACHYVDGRSAFQCFTRFQKSLEATIRRGRWTKEEDDLLKRAVEKFKQRHGSNGTISFQYVATFVPGRTDASCRERWTSHLNPDIKKGNFSPSEDALLIQLMHQVVFSGRDSDAYYKRSVSDRIPTIPWSQFAKTSFQGRSDTALKDRYDTILRNYLRKIHVDTYSPETMEKLERLREVPWKKWKDLGGPESYKKPGRKRKIPSDVSNDVGSALNEILGPSTSEECAPQQKPAPRKRGRKPKNQPTTSIPTAESTTATTETGMATSDLAERATNANTVSQSPTPLSQTPSTTSESTSTTSLSNLSVTTSDSTIAPPPSSQSTQPAQPSQTQTKRTRKQKVTRFEQRRRESVWGKRLRARTMTPSTETSHDGIEVQHSGYDMTQTLLDEVSLPPVQFNEEGSGEHGASQVNQTDDLGALLNDILGEESFVIE